MGILADYVNFRRKNGKSVAVLTSIGSSLVSPRLQSFEVISARNGFLQIDHPQLGILDIKVDVESQQVTHDGYILCTADREHFANYRRVNEHPELPIATVLVDIKSISHRFAKASELLHMPWTVQRKTKNGIERRKVVRTETTNGFVQVEGETDLTCIYGEHILRDKDVIAKGESPWVIDPSCPLFNEMNRLFRLYMEKVTVDHFQAMRAALPWSKLAYMHNPALSTAPGRVVVLLVDPVGRTSGYRVTHDGKFAWTNINERAWANEGYDIVD
ncbi:hypothetical protein AVT69_gp356 [Pseudomonas phage PhiPA3]|uniref:Uncharacterized protein 358 n=1 Tax=Pseudomonas phage PhiPA3 TaxID=998086 RepID=F8SJJ0_BPPA3|nr:hypothetical protein AVT69_gp356 [Pseudomonas phage PhiPA3]AEH03781.1 hypothetical protein [Pseudomonas phage PhiPA3]